MPSPSVQKRFYPDPPAGVDHGHALRDYLIDGAIVMGGLVLIVGGIYATAQTAGVGTAAGVGLAARRPLLISGVFIANAATAKPN